MGCVQVTGIRYVYTDDLKDDRLLNTAKQYVKNGWVVLVIHKHYKFDDSYIRFRHMDDLRRIINTKTGETIVVNCNKPGIYNISERFSTPD